MVPHVVSSSYSHHDFLKHLYNVGVASCHPRTVLPTLLPSDAPAGRNIVLGAGKAAAEMAAVASETLAGATEGLVVTRYGHGSKSSAGNIEVIEAGHPIPDEKSVVAASRMLDLAKSAQPDDRVLFMFSGGGSALLCAPIDGITVQSKQEITRFLLHSGAGIDEINCVRRHLSRIKGGRLLQQVREAEILTFLISDVVGDNPSAIASGPSIPANRDVDGAIDVLRKYGYADFDDIADTIMRTPDADARKHPVKLVANAAKALAAVAHAAEAGGWTPVVLGDDIEGNAAEIGRQHADLALDYSKQDRRIALISGGELTVRVTNQDGRGGPNLEYLTGLMIGLDGSPGINAIACDSDGIDGSEDNAGARISPTSLTRAAQKSLDPESLLQQNDTYRCFEALGDLVITGPTRTNVNDIRVILISPHEERVSD